MVFKFTLNIHFTSYKISKYIKNFVKKYMTYHNR